MTEARPVPGWPGYSATSDGRIVGPRGHPLRPRAHHRTGHLRVRLYGPHATLRAETVGASVRAKRYEDVYVHVLVALAFHGAPPAPEAALVLHADGDSQNNRPENLRWGTRQANADDYARHSGGSVDSQGFDWSAGT